MSTMASSDMVAHFVTAYITKLLLLEFTLSNIITAATGISFVTE